MKTVTLLCGIALVLNAVFGVYSLASNLMRVGMFRPTMLPYMLNEGTWVLAEACMAAFFFILYSRQKT